MDAYIYMHIRINAYIYFHIYVYEALSLCSNPLPRDFYSLATSIVKHSTHTSILGSHKVGMNHSLVGDHMDSRIYLYVYIPHNISNI